MSKIKTITGVAADQVDSATMGNVITIVATKAAGLVITDPQIEVFVQNPNMADAVRIADITPLIALAELKALHKDSIIKTESTITNGATMNDPATEVVTKIEYKFDISELHGIALGEQDRVRIALSGLDAAATYEVYHEESKTGSKVHKNYKIVGTDSTPNVKFNFDKEVTAFAIKKGSNFRGVEIKFSNSHQTIPMLPEEIEMRTREEKGFVYERKKTFANGITTVDLDSNNQVYYTIPVNGIDYIQVNTDETNVQTITERTKLR